jgi:uncharacterized cupredoxin-like copper-binding protein
MFSRVKLIKAVALISVAVFAGLVMTACAGASNNPSANNATGASNNPSPNNAVVRVMQDEFHMKPDIASVPAGKVTFVVVNQGKVDHEMVLLKTDKAPDKLVVQSGASKIDEAASGENLGEVEVEAGETNAGTFELTPGKYVLICNIVDHYKAAMYSAFEVTGTAVKAAVPASATAVSKPAAIPVVPGARKDIALVKAVRPTLVNTLDAAQKGDIAGTKKALHEYDIQWHGIEVYVAFRSAKLYGELETDIQARLTKILDDPQAKPADIVSTSKELLAKFDEVIAMVETSSAISPVFDDLEAIRMLKAETINEIAPMLKAGDVASAKATFTQFMSRWPDVEDIIKAYSVDAYADTESAMAKANTAFQKSKPDVAELTPLVADTLARYNFGQSLVNAAARNADPTKTTFTKDDVQLAAGVSAIQAELNASLPLWQAGKYKEAGDHARLANGDLYAKVSAALKAKNDADVPFKKALDAYTALSDKSGDATTTRAAQKAAFEAAAVAQQVLVGQFWTDPKFKDAITAALQAK